jgi:hypothetical protein
MRKIAAVALAVSSLLAAPAAKAVSPAKSAPSKPIDGWYIKQKMDYHGDVEIFAAEPGVKIKTRTLCVYLKPGDTEGTLVNESNRTISVVDRKLWTDSNMMSSGLSKDVPAAILAQFKVPLKPPTMIAGHKCVQHWAAAYRHDKSFWLWWEYWTPTDMKLPKGMADEWRTILHLPPGDSIPLLAVRHFRLHQSSYKALVFLSTEVVKKTPVTIADLQPPKGYKRVADEMDMVLGSGGKADEISDLFDGTKGGTSKKLSDTKKK